MGMRASLQSFAEKSLSWKYNLHFILFTDIQHKSNASPWPAKFNAIHMQPHAPLQGFCRETKSCWHPLTSAVQICWGTEWRFRGVFLGEWSEGFNFVQLIECAPAVTFPGTTGHCCPLEMRKTSFSECCSFSLYSCWGTGKTNSRLLLASYESCEPRQVLNCSGLTHYGYHHLAVVMLPYGKE